MSRLVPVPRSRTLLTLTGLAFVIPFAVILILAGSGTQLGEGYFILRYSPLRGARTMRALAMIPVGLSAAGAVWLLASSMPWRRRAGAGILLLCAVLAGAWIWWAPPRPLTQHMFNLTSPSSDGAFVLELGEVRSASSYLRDFPKRLEATPEQMGGTRVLSNPPGMTIFAYVVTAGEVDESGWLARFLMEHEQIPAGEVALPVATVRLGVALCAVWVLAGVAAYGLGRVFLSPAGAGVFAVIATFNPSAVEFSPGKDPAQLLTINLMLLMWFAGWKWTMRGAGGFSPSPGTPGEGRGEGSALSAIDRRMTATATNPRPALSRRTGRGETSGVAPWLSFVAGAVLAIGSMVGLIHIWVAIAAVIATGWASRRRMRAFLTRNVLPAVIGFVFVCAVAWMWLGCNIPLTLWAVSRRWAEIQKTFEMNRAVWYAIGLPIFSLFLSSGFWTLLGLSLKNGDAVRFSGPRRRLAKTDYVPVLAVTVSVMGFIYFVMGVTYELPRLWIAFLPLLTLGLAMASPLLRGRASHRGVATLLAMIVFGQVVFTAFHWTFFDVRESEWRLSSQRYYK